MVNYYNPIRMYVTLLRISKTFANLVGTVDEAFANLQASYDELILRIIDNVSISSVMRNWLYDEADQNYKVIDYLAHLDCLNVISHIKVLKVSEQIWMGVYDITTADSANDVIKNAPAVYTFAKFNVSLDEASSNFGKGYWFNTFYYCFKVVYEYTRSLIKARHDEKNGIVNLHRKSKLRTSNRRAATWIN